MMEKRKPDRFVDRSACRKFRLAIPARHLFVACNTGAGIRGAVFAVSGASACVTYKFVSSTFPAGEERRAR
jgi:hypothetical protein